jgi:hypothetical protein
MPKGTIVRGVQVYLGVLSCLECRYAWGYCRVSSTGMPVGIIVSGVQISLVTSASSTVNSVAKYS